MELNGGDVTLDQIKVLALTNYGHFTSMLVEEHQVRGLSLHMQRLARDCRQLFNVELDTDRVRDYIRHVLGGPPRTVVRVTIYDPSLDLGSIGSDADPHVLVTTRTASETPASPLRLQGAAYQREMPVVKHIGLFGALQHRRATQREGFDDALFLNPDGIIAEITTSNVGFIRDGRIVWPRSEYLAGITMTLLHRELDETVTTEPLTLSDMPGMDAAFATNAVTGVRPVVCVDSTQWSSEHKVLTELRELYADIDVVISALPVRRPRPPTLTASTGYHRSSSPILLVFESDDEVAHPPHHDYVTVRLAASSPVDPQVEDVMRVHVGKQRRHRCPCPGNPKKPERSRRRLPLCAPLPAPDPRPG